MIQMPALQSTISSVFSKCDRFSRSKWYSRVWTKMKPGNTNKTYTPNFNASSMTSTSGRDRVQADLVVVAAEAMNRAQVTHGVALPSRTVIDFS
jgi:hypothetical protein